jgi:hypothetical protein
VAQAPGPRAHPDAGGDHDLFIWARELQERVSEGLTIGPAAAPARSPEPAAPPRRRDGTSRIPFETGVPLTFEDLTARALELAPTFREPYPAIFRMLVGCPPLRGWPEELRAEARAGAGFKKLALAGRTLGLDGAGRGGFYKAASKVPLSDLHARYLLDRLQAGDRPPGWPPPGDAGA